VQVEQIGKIQTAQEASRRMHSGWMSWHQLARTASRATSFSQQLLGLSAIFTSNRCASTATGHAALVAQVFANEFDFFIIAFAFSRI
jgi:hypothetical protein